MLPGLEPWLSNSHGLESNDSVRIPLFSTGAAEPAEEEGSKKGAVFLGLGYRTYALHAPGSRTCVYKIPAGGSIFNYFINAIHTPNNPRPRSLDSTPKHLMK
eukprot:4461713-Prymnesium_polylepis.1